MKINKVMSVLLALVLALSMAGCGDKNNGGTDPAVGTDGADGVILQNMVDTGPLDYDLSVYPGKEICTTGSVVYTYDDVMIYFFDKASGLSMPLCGKPECVHNDETCTAYVGWNCEALSVYDGKLYWVTNYDGVDKPTAVMRSELDGTGRATVVEFDTHSKENAPLFGSINSNRRLFIHRGHLYVWGTGVAKSGMGSALTIISVSLTDGNVTNLFYAENAGRCSVKPVGDEIYVMMSNAKGRDLSNFIWGTEHLEAHRIHLDTGVSEKLFSFDSDAENISYECWDSLPVPGDGLYFERTYEYEISEGTGEYDSIASILKYSFASGQIEEVTPKLDADGYDSFFWVEFLNNCIVTRSVEATYLFDYNGRYLMKSDYKSFSTSPALVDDEYVYYYEMGRDESFHSTGEEYYVCVPIGGGDAIRFE